MGKLRPDEANGKVAPWPDCRALVQLAARGRALDAETQRKAEIVMSTLMHTLSGTAHRCDTCGANETLAALHRAATGASRAPIDKSRLDIAAEATLAFLMTARDEELDFTVPAALSLMCERNPEIDGLDCTPGSDDMETIVAWVREARQAPEAHRPKPKRLAARILSRALGTDEAQVLDRIKQRRKRRRE